MRRRYWREVAKLPSERVFAESACAKDLLRERVAGLWLCGPLGDWSLVSEALAGWFSGRLVLWAAGPLGGWSLVSRPLAGWSLVC